MSDDIDRLKKVLEDMRVLNDTLHEDRNVARDVIAAVKPVELETDPEGHAALRDFARDIYSEFQNLVYVSDLMHIEMQALLAVARA